MIRDCSVGSSISTSPTAPSSSVCVTLRAHPLGFDDARHCDDLVTAHDERPRLALGAGDLGVDEHILDLPPAPGKSVAGAPPSYLKATLAGGDPPRAPADLAIQRDRGLLEPDLVVLPDRGNAAAEVEPLRADR